MPLHGSQGHVQRVRLRTLLQRRGPAAPYLRALLDAGKVLHLHAGCGNVLLSGWLNTDLLDMVGADGEVSRLGHAYLARGHVYVKHDASDPYPIPSGTATSVYSEHFIEHLSLVEAQAWLRELHRVLKPGGVVRISTPDLEQFVRGYLDEKQALFGAWNRALKTHGVQLPPRRALRLNTLMREWGHRYLYDYEELALALSKARFREIRRCQFRTGTGYMAQHDQEWRRPGNLYVEAKKA